MGSMPTNAIRTLATSRPKVATSPSPPRRTRTQHTRTSGCSSDRRPRGIRGIFRFGPPRARWMNGSPSRNSICFQHLRGHGKYDAHSILQEQSNPHNYSPPNCHNDESEPSQYRLTAVSPMNSTQQSHKHLDLLLPLHIGICARSHRSPMYVWFFRLAIPTSYWDTCTSSCRMTSAWLSCLIPHPSLMQPSVADTTMRAARLPDQAMLIGQKRGAFGRSVHRAPWALRSSRTKTKTKAQFGARRKSNQFV